MTECGPRPKRDMRVELPAAEQASALAEEVVVAWLDADYSSDRQGQPTQGSLAALKRRFAKALLSKRRGRRADEVEVAATCIAAGCNEPPSRRGMCLPHFFMWAKAKGFGGGLRVMTEPPPGDPKPMGVCVEPEEMSQHRHLGCPAYSLCLNWAMMQRWRGFTCRGCKGPA